MAREGNAMKRKRIKPIQHSSYKKTVLSIVLVLLVALVILLNIFTHVFAIVRYFGNGMEPALRNGQTLILHRTENVKEGDCVTLIGRDGECEITADEIASLTGTINYEVVCDVSKRVPRKYVGI